MKAKPRGFDLTGIVNSSAWWREGVHLPEDDPQVIAALIRSGVGALVRQGTPMLKVVHEESKANENRVVPDSSLLDEIVRDGARQMLAAALQAEVAAYIEPM